MGVDDRERAGAAARVDSSEDASRPEGVRTGVPEGSAATSPALALFALFLSSLYIRLLNVALFPAMAAVAPFVRDASTACGIAANLLVVVTALRLPSALGVALRPALGPAVVTLGFASVAAGLALGGGVGAGLVAVGACVWAVGAAPVMLQVLDSLCDLGFRRLVVGIPLMGAAAYLAAFLLSVCPDGVTLAVAAGCVLVAAALVRRSSVGIARLMADSPALDGAALLRPSSYLPLTSVLYVCMLLVSAADGFCQRFASVEGGPWGLPVAAAVLAALAAWNVGARDAGRFDKLFSLVVIVVMAGFLTALLPAFEWLSTVLIDVGSGVATALFDLVMVCVAARNRRASPLVFAWGGAMSTLGAIMGANVGALVRAVPGDAASLLVVAVAVATLAYVELGMGGFGFAETIEGISPDSGDVAPAAPERPGDIDGACALVGRQYGLTPRESDVLALLARGRNGAHIEEELVLSHNTVKSYIKHVYAKLGVHSQQELIDMVEAAVPARQAG
ncbi:MAG: helix-turn-helix transcriptional regulator [Coriobacteriales bacterium]|jgi:DNA-binding CsgD family transcriptional regulator